MQYYGIIFIENNAKYQTLIVKFFERIPMYIGHVPA